MVDITDPRLIDFPGMTTAVVHEPAQPTAELPTFMDRAFGALGQAIAHGDVVPAGPAFSRHDGKVLEGIGERADVQVGFPVDSPLEAAVQVEDVIVQPSTLPAGRLAITTYTGPYENLGEAWGEFLSRLHAQGLTPIPPVWEAYDTEPGPDVDPSTLQTGLAVRVEE